MNRRLLAYLAAVALPLLMLLVRLGLPVSFGERPLPIRVVSIFKWLI